MTLGNFIHPIKLLLFVHPSNVFALVLYQPGPGAIMALGVSNDFITLNTASLSYVNTGHPVHNHVYFKSYLVSNQTGKHEIFGTCATAFAFTISLLDGQSEKSSTVKRQVVFTTQYRSISYVFIIDPC